MSESKQVETGTRPPSVILLKPTNLGFESGLEGWSVPPAIHLAGFSVQTRSSECAAGTTCAEILRENSGYGEGVGSLAQQVDAAPLRGKTIHVRGAVRADVPRGSEARVWVGATGPGPRGPTSSLAVDNMRERGITDAKWRTYDVTIAVPQNAVTVGYGAVLIGAGRCVIDDFSATIANEGSGRMPSTTAKCSTS